MKFSSLFTISLCRLARNTRVPNISEEENYRTGVAPRYLQRVESSSKCRCGNKDIYMYIRYTYVYTYTHYPVGNDRGGGQLVIARRLPRQLRDSDERVRSTRSSSRLDIPRSPLSTSRRATLVS